MSDFYSQSTPDGDSNNSGALPAPRSGQDQPKPGTEEPAQISLEEMMERLQRSGRKSSGENRSGESRSGESRSGRRRRSSSSSDSSKSSGSLEWEASPPPPTENIRKNSRSGESSQSAFTRAVLPPPRQAAAPATRPALPKNTSSRPRNRTWLFILLGFLLLGGLIWVGIMKLNRWRIEGDGFRINAARRISEIVDRRVSFSRFQQPAADQLNNAVVTITPTHSDLIDSMNLEQLTGEFAMGSWLAEDWTLRSLRIRKTDITFQPNKILDANTINIVPAAPADRGANASQGFRLSMTSDPTALVLERGRLDQVNLTWPGPDGSPETLSNLEGSFVVADQTVNFDFINGLLDTAGWPPMPVRQVSAQLRGTSLQIVSARLGITEENSILLKGSAELIPDGNLKLTASIEPVLLKHILPKAWAGSALGTFQAENATWLSHFSGGTAPPPPPATLGGAFRVKGFVLRSFPFLVKIATLLRNPDLIMIEFPNLNGDFSWTPAATQLTNLSAATQDGLLRLKGNVTVVPGADLTGRITIEANEAYFAGLPADQGSLFTKDGDGWRTVTFKINGPDSSALVDDIGISEPAYIPKRPMESLPKMTLPPGTAIPQSAPPVAAPAATRPITPAPLLQLPPPAPIRPASDKELEREFNQLLEQAKPSRKTAPQLPSGNRDRLF